MYTQVNINNVPFLMGTYPNHTLNYRDNRLVTYPDLPTEHLYTGILEPRSYETCREYQLRQLVSSLRAIQALRRAGYKIVRCRHGGLTSEFIPPSQGN